MLKTSLKTNNTVEVYAEKNFFIYKMVSSFISNVFLLFLILFSFKYFKLSFLMLPTIILFILGYIFELVIYKNYCASAKLFVDKKGIHIKKGIIFQTETVIPHGTTYIISENKNLFMSTFGIKTLKFETVAQTKTFYGVSNSFVYRDDF